MHREILTIDHRVEHRSNTHSAAGDAIQLFVREKRLPSLAEDAPAVLFVHGATYPSVVDFDLDFEDYSWMAFLARAGFRVFAMDCAGYGGSTRLRQDSPKLAADGAPGDVLRSAQADAADMRAVTRFIAERTGAKKLRLIGWSGGGTRVAIYAARHPELVESLMLVAPGYARNAPGEDAPRTPGPPLKLTTRAAFEKAWGEEVRRPDQVDPLARDRVWALNLEIDSDGARWDPPVVRGPNYGRGFLDGCNAAMAAKIGAPALLVAMEWDAHVPFKTVQRLYEDLGSERKVLAAIGGASHYLPWERDHGILHRMSLEWLERGALGGVQRGNVAINMPGAATD